MSESKSYTRSSTTGLLTVAFVVLKLCKVIDWSWWWVLSPIWIVVGIVLIALIVKAAMEVREEDKAKSQPRPKSKWGERLDQMNEARRKAGGK